MAEEYETVAKTNYRMTRCDICDRDIPAGVEMYHTTGWGNFEIGIECISCHEERENDK
jgi:hypothetical protein